MQSGVGVVEKTRGCQIFFSTGYFNLQQCVQPAKLGDNQRKDKYRKPIRQPIIKTEKKQGHINKP
jgi:hypothetical protein